MWKYRVAIVLLMVCLIAGVLTWRQARRSRSGVVVSAPAGGESGHTPPEWVAKHGERQLDDMRAALPSELFDRKATLDSAHGRDLETALTELASKHGVKLVYEAPKLMTSGDLYYEGRLGPALTNLMGIHPITAVKGADGAIHIVPMKDPPKPE
jgi:hypothetical protein